jgi:hypothetical protein
MVGPAHTNPGNKNRRNRKRYFFMVFSVNY